VWRRGSGEHALHNLVAPTSGFFLAKFISFIIHHGAEYMSKPPKVPRPVKPPIRPAEPGEQLSAALGSIHERLIGRVVVAWSRLESAMGNFIWLLLDLDVAIGRILTARMDAAAMIKLLRELGEATLSESYFHEISTVLAQIDIVRDDRNLIMHGLWKRNSRGTPMASSLRQKPPSPTQIVSETFDDNRMRGLIQTIDALHHRLVTLMHELRA
jgi:hypothetical protein